MGNKVFASAAQAIEDIPDGATVMVGGFGLCGIPENLIRALVKRGVRNLHTLANDMAVPGAGLSLLLECGSISEHTASYVGGNPLLADLMFSGKLKVNLMPQGNFAESIRAAGAGIPAFFTPAGVGTSVSEGRELRRFGERAYMLQEALSADFALVKAWRGDTKGNLVYRKTARNFNPMMATAAKITIAEVEELVEPGQLDGDHIVTPGIYVKRILQGGLYERRVDKLRFRQA